MATKIQPGSPELREYYSARHQWRGSGEERIRFRKAARHARVPAGARVLDIGARDGGLRTYLPRDVQYQGMDIAPEFESPSVLIRDISEGIPFPDATFDAAFCIEVLEHVPNPFGAMGEVNRVLKPGGVFLVSVPNPYHFKEIVWNVLRIPDRQGHIYNWTRQGMIALGGMNGFRLEETGGTYLHPPIPIGGLLARSIVYRFVKE